MSRYIDKAKLAQRLLASPIFKNTQNGDLIRDAVIDIVCDYPTADVVEVRHGAWIKQKPDEEAMKEFRDMGLGKGMGVNSIYWTCSVCENWGTPNHKYCSSCGAKMKGE